MATIKRLGKCVNVISVYEHVRKIQIVSLASLIIIFYFKLQFSHESAYPKQNPNPQMRQFITCSAESYILIWDLKKPPAEIKPQHATIAPIDDEDSDDVFEEEEEKKETPKFKGWASLKSKTSTIVTSYAFSTSKKWTPAVGK